MGNIAIGFENGYSLMIVADGNGRVQELVEQPVKKGQVLPPELEFRTTVVASAGVRNFGAGREVCYRICRKGGFIIGELQTRNLKLVDAWFAEGETFLSVMAAFKIMPEMWEMFAV